MKLLHALSIDAGVVPPRDRAGTLFDVEQLALSFDRAAVRRVLAAHSTLSGQEHALSSDPWRVLWSPSRRAFLPFLERKFVLVGWRDPVGPPEEAAALLARFRAFAERERKHAVVLGVSRAAAEACSAARYSMTWIGGEPFIDLARWTMAGGKAAKLRLAVNHARGAGAVAGPLDPERVPGVRAEMAEVEERWKAARRERATSSFLRTAPFERMYDRRYFGVRDKDGLQSFLVCSPIGRDAMYLQDLVRLPAARRGSAELVCVEAIDALRREGTLRVSLGIVPLLDESGTRRLEASGLARVGLRFFDRRYRFEGLRRFRAKFPATHVEPISVAIWPRILSPLMLWGLIGALA